jgi:predicted nicotinamide N-methyase
VYPDGHEELVRGARLVEFGTQSSKDVIAVSSARAVYHRVVASGSYPIPNEMLDQMEASAGPSLPLASYVVPAMLLEDLSLERMAGEQPKPPLSPPPVRASR